VNLKPNCTFEQKQELICSLRDLLQDRMHNLLEFSHRHGFRVKAGSKKSVMVTLGNNNVHFVHEDA
jgi:hypothetical protein